VLGLDQFECIGGIMPSESFAYSPLDCDFTTGQCPECGKKYPHGTRRNCPKKSHHRNSPGTLLHALIKEIGVKYSCHACGAMVAQMNAWGVEGCQLPENRQRIIAKLKQGAKEASWSDRFSALVGMATAGWLNPLRPFESMLDEAIRRSEQ
jgi:hypothetical protein